MRKVSLTIMRKVSLYATLQLNHSSP